MFSNALPADRLRFNDCPLSRAEECGWCAVAATCGGVSGTGARPERPITAGLSAGARCSGDMERRQTTAVWTLHKGEHAATIDLKAVPGIGAEIDTRSLS